MKTNSQLVRSAQGGNLEALEKLFSDHFPLVKGIVGKFRFLPPGLEYEDLLGAGNLGLLYAIDRFDPLRGVKLEVFAAECIRREIINELYKSNIIKGRKKSWQWVGRIRTAVEMFQKEMQDIAKVTDPAYRASKAGEAIRELNQVGEDITIFFVQKILDDLITQIKTISDCWDLSRIERLSDSVKLMYKTIAYERRSRRGFEDTDIASEAALSAFLVTEGIEKKELRKLLFYEISRLSKRQQKVIFLSFFHESFGFKEKPTQTAIGQVIGGVTAARVNQIKSDALKILAERCKYLLEVMPDGE